MNKVIILGAGAHAAEIEGYVSENNNQNEKIEIIGYYDNNENNNWEKYKLKKPLLGGIQEYQPNDDIGVLIGFANIQFRKELIQFYLKKNATFVNFIHHTAFVFDSAKIGIGNVICRNCLVGPNVNIGNFNTLNNFSTIGHDSSIGDNNILCPNVGFSGSTTVGDNNFFSLNSVTIPNINIENDNVIAPNMTIDKNISSNSTVFYRFKEKLIFQKK